MFKVDTPETPTSNFVEIKWREYSYLTPLHLFLGGSVTLGLLLTVNNVKEWALSTSVVLPQCLLLVFIPNLLFYLVRRKKNWNLNLMIKSILLPVPFYLIMSLIALVFIVI